MADSCSSCVAREQSPLMSPTTVKVDRGSPDPVVLPELVLGEDGRGRVTPLMFLLGFIHCLFVRLLCLKNTTDALNPLLRDCSCFLIVFTALAQLFGTSQVSAGSTSSLSPRDPCTLLHATQCGMGRNHFFRFHQGGGSVPCLYVQGCVPHAAECHVLNSGPCSGNRQI